MPSPRAQIPRPTPLIATFAGCALLAFAPAVAQARALGERQGRCHVFATAAASKIAAGEAVELVGTLECASAEQDGGQPVTIYAHESGTPGLVQVAETSTEADGSFKASVPDVSVNSSFTAVAMGAKSRRAVVKVTPGVTLAGPPAGTVLRTALDRARSAARATNAVTFTGVETPAQPGATVVLQRSRGADEGRWRRIATGVEGPGGEYSISHVFSGPGEVHLRVVVRSGHRARPAVSEILSYLVAQRQRTGLTIEASSLSLAIGESVTISGQASGDGGQQATLLARSDGGPFTALGTVVVQSDGSYGFAASSPLQDTDYQVRVGHHASTVLSVGVHALILAQASNATVASGETVTFSGTVSSQVTSGIVQLERLNASGTGFRVLRVGKIEPGSTFSIELPITGSGEQVYRVELPKSTSNEAAWSATLPVQVTR